MRRLGWGYRKGCTRVGGPGVHGWVRITRVIETSTAEFSSSSGLGKLICSRSAAFSRDLVWVRLLLLRG